jgi:hypothetical protein
VAVAAQLLAGAVTVHLLGIAIEHGSTLARSSAHSGAAAGVSGASRVEVAQRTDLGAVMADLIERSGHKEHCRMLRTGRTDCAQAASGRTGCVGVLRRPRLQLRVVSSLDSGPQRHPALTQCLGRVDGAGEDWVVVRYGDVQPLDMAWLAPRKSTSVRRLGIDAMCQSSHPIVVKGAFSAAEMCASKSTTQSPVPNGCRVRQSARRRTPQASPTGSQNNSSSERPSQTRPSVKYSILCITSRRVSARLPVIEEIVTQILLRGFQRTADLPPAGRTDK